MRTALLCFGLLSSALSLTHAACRHSSENVRPTGSIPVQLRPPPGAAQLCSGSVYAPPPGLHISWVAWHLAETPEAVTARYLAELGSANHAQETFGDLWRFPTTEAPERVLEVSPASRHGPWEECGHPPASARTVVMISSSPR